MSTVLPAHKYLVRFEAPFKDGNLFPQFIAAGFEVGSVPGTIRQGSQGWMNERLYTMAVNSGASLEIVKHAIDIPPSTRMSPAMPEPEVPDEITLDDLDMSDSARTLAVKHGVLAVELLETLGEWELFTDSWLEHKFSKPEVQKVIDAWKD
jgi:hypothetical protein